MVIPGDPGRRVESLRVNPDIFSSSSDDDDGDDLLLSWLWRAVSVWEPIRSTEVGVGVVGDDVKGMLDVPMMTADAPRDISVPESAIAGPFWVRTVPAMENIVGWGGEGVTGVAGVVIGVYVLPAIMIGWVSGVVGWELDSSSALWSVLTAL